MTTPNIEDLDPSVLSYIAKLRRESAAHRIARNEARAEADRLRAELEALRGAAILSDG